MRKCLNLIFVILLCFTSQVTTVPAHGASYAVDLTADLKIINAQEGGNAYLLLDGDVSTGVIVENGTKLLLNSREAVKQLYLVWDTPHSAWDITALGGESQTFGRDGFIHEYIELEQPLVDFTMEFRGTQEALCDIYVFGEGDPPEWVQQWTPPHKEADMLLIPVHAGEEFAFYGGTIPLYAGERGLKLQVAYLTGLWNEPSRTHELLNGLYSAGMRNYPVISNFPDEYVATVDEARQIYDENALIEFQVEQIRRFRPKVVLSSGIGGEYGHGMNTLCAEALLAAVEISTDGLEFRDSEKKYGAWDVPKTYLHLYPENRALINWDTKLSNFHGKTAIEVAEAAFDMSVPWNENFKIETSGPYDCRKFGLARSTVGPDVTGKDFFENLSPESAQDSSPPAAAEIHAELESTPSAPDQSSGRISEKNFKHIAVTGVAAAFCLLAAAALRMKKD